MKKNIKGFTIIELIVVIVIIGILSTISIVGLNVIQQGSRNTQRSSAMSAIAEALEKYYMKNGEYPSCAMMTQSTSATTVANALFPGFSPSNLTAPTDSTPDHNSFVCTNPPASPAQYSYEYGVTSYTLQYQEEGTSNIDSLDSRHHANAPNYNLTITCPNGTPSGSGTFAAGSSDPFGCTPNQYYSVTGWTGSAGCSDGSPIYLNDNKTCNAITAPTPLSAPSAPVVTDSNLPSPTTYSWNAASCGTGNTAGYRYDYTIPESSYDSGWATTAATSQWFNTWDDGYHYNLAVQAYCYNPVASSPWSATGNNLPIVYVPTPYCTLTVNAGSNGTASGGGSYDCGTSPATPVITASPNTYYQFTGWSGSGCTGGGNNPATITMTGNITCTASFGVINITPANPSIWENGTFGTTIGFSWSDACPADNGPAATINYSWASYIGGTLSHGWFGVGTVTSANETTYLSPGTTYTFEVSAYCSNPAVGNSATTYGTYGFYRSYWINGAAGGMLGHYVYWTDLGSQYTYKADTAADASPQGLIGLDTSHPSDRALVNPQNNPGIDWVSYPAYMAQNQCRLLGGYVPYAIEWHDLWTNRAVYGNAFQASGYWAGEETTDYPDTTQAILWGMSAGTQSQDKKNVLHYVRCATG